MKIIKQGIAVVLIGLSAGCQHMPESGATWSYRERVDNMTGESFTVGYNASEETGRRVEVGFTCKKGEMFFYADAGRPVTVPGGSFEFSYRPIDIKMATIRLNTYSNSYDGGVTYEGVQEIAERLLSTSSYNMFISFTASTGEDIRASVYLWNTQDEAIKSVFRDCGVELFEADS